MLFEIMNLGVKSQGLNPGSPKQMPGCLTMGKFLIFPMSQVLYCQMGVMIRLTSYSCEVCIQQCFKDLAHSKHLTTQN